ncbi:hypothetical protein D3C84_588150 [compost metagenome]
MTEALLAALGEALLAFVEDLPGELGELRAQLVARALYLLQALTVALLLLAQRRTQRRPLGGQVAQFLLALLALLLPLLRRLGGLLPLDAEQLYLAAQRRGFALQAQQQALLALALATRQLQPAGQFAAGLLAAGQALLEQADLLLGPTALLLQGPQQRGQRQGRSDNTEQQAGQLEGHDRTP